MKRIYLYLFLFSLIINIFLIVNDSKVLKAKEEHIEHLEEKLKKAEDSLQKIQTIQQIDQTTDTLFERI
ncbi:hypothetical protein SAMN02927937_00829 [Paenimyroides aquimaris]|uniref:Uncharacterized protein n=1 Tax=Paenimyroides marinum TaxID=1159016 RepID=A0A1H6K6W4_9FLAO|nr:hypothetical protein [Paenimyroides aquimaris]SEH67536.1 hypothetical protein SAMN02927937_00829 [Paenimyroides aquimaris]